MKTLLLIFASLALSTYSLLGQLVGISYNPDTNENEFRTVNPESGVTSVLNTFQFASGGYYGLFSDPARNVAYAPSGQNELYRFDLTTGQILGVTSIERDYPNIAVGGTTGLSAIYYDSNSMEYSLNQLDPLTGAVNPLTVIPTAGGLGSLISNPLTDVGYTTNGPDSVLKFDLNTGANLGTIQLPFAYPNLQAGVDGDLAGILYNFSTEKNELYAIDGENGQATLLNTWAFTSGYYSAFLTDPLGERAYALSGANDIYTFDLRSGDILNIAPLDSAMQNFAIGPADPQFNEIPEPQYAGAIGLILLFISLYFRRFRQPKKVA